LFATVGKPRPGGAARRYLFSEVFALKPTSESLKNPAHLSTFYLYETVSAKGAAFINSSPWRGF
jgi:hypothetical protein